MESFPRPTVQPIVGKPSYLPIAALLQQCTENAASIPSTLGGGAHGHAGQVLSATDYAALPNTAPFVVPANPGATATIPAGSTGPQIAAIERLFKQQTVIYQTYRNVDAALQQQILAAVPRKYLKALYHRTTGFMGVTARQMLEHLQRNYGTISTSQYTTNDERFRTPYDPNEPIEDLFERIDDAIEFADKGAIPYTAPQIVKNAYNLLFASGLFTDACREWKKKPAADQTYANLQTHFTEAEAELRESQMTAAQHGAPHGANNMEKENEEPTDAEINKTADALMNLATATQADRKMLADLTNMNNTLIAQLATKDTEIAQLRAAIQTSKKAAPPPPAQGMQLPWMYNMAMTPPPWTQTAPRKYCHTHGFFKKGGHSSWECQKPKEGHKKQATAENTMNGNQRNKNE